MNLADAAALKKKGNDLFGRGKYSDAVEAYTAAIDLWMETHDRAVLYSNRSAARLKIAGEKQKALSDAERAVQLDQHLRPHVRWQARDDGSHLHPLHPRLEVRVGVGD